MNICCIFRSLIGCRHRETFAPPVRRVTRLCNVGVVAAEEIAQLLSHASGRDEIILELVRTGGNECPALAKRGGNRLTR
jgi:hypothetical protein